MIMSNSCVIVRLLSCLVIFGFYGSKVELTNVYDNWICNDARFV